MNGTAIRHERQFAPPAGARALGIRVALDPARARAWHGMLIRRLRDAGHEVALARRAAPSVQSGFTAFLLGLQAAQSRRRGSSAWALLGETGIQTLDNHLLGRAPDLEIDLTGGETPVDPRAPSMRVLRPVYGAALAEEAAAHALLTGDMPLIGVVDSAAPRHPVMLRLGREDELNALRTLNAIAMRLCDMLIKCVDRVAQGEIVYGAAVHALDDAPGWSLSERWTALTRNAAALWRRIAPPRDDWQVLWRMAGADRMSETLRLASDGWTALADDRRRYYADPMVVFAQGRHWIFVEEFPYATRKGILSVLELGPEGALGAPRPVLEQAYHLSYPFVFEHARQMWMLPETSSAGRIELYRAAGFPFRWERAATLVDNVAAADPTIVRHEGRFYLFASVGGAGASDWDALAVWHAPDIFGPWTALPDNPVFIGAEASRPAGPLFRRSDGLYRPAQDCSRSYGGALSLVRIDRLDPEGFEQSVCAIAGPDQDWASHGCHHLSWSAGVEAIDIVPQRGPAAKKR